MTTNDAAERLRAFMAGETSRYTLDNQSELLTLDAALAAERRATVEPLLAAMKHAKVYLDKALDKNAYGDAVEGDLLEAHAALDTAILDAETER